MSRSPNGFLFLLFFSLFLESELDLLMGTGDSAGELAPEPGRDPGWRSSSRRDSSHSFFCGKSELLKSCFQDNTRNKITKK